MEANISTLHYLNLQIDVYTNDLANILAWIISFPQSNYPSSYQRKTISRWNQKCKMGKMLNKMKFHEFKESLWARKCRQSLESRRTLAGLTQPLFCKVKKFGITIMNLEKYFIESSQVRIQVTISYYFTIPNMETSWVFQIYGLQICMIRF